MTWQEICDDPILRELPYKIETNEWGQLILTRLSLRQGAYRARLGAQLMAYTDKRSLMGESVMNAAIVTAQGIKVTDIGWFSQERWYVVKAMDAASLAPQICIDILLSATLKDYCALKKALYFAAGAEEVWLCSAEGRVTFYGPEGELPLSVLIPDFPKLMPKLPVNQTNDRSFL